ncbi:uracil-DNA glycosylase [Pelagivirga sediminicola]|uniref:Type-4 uracil-DNA glycosylase n=1 Tax=Pelagivirga sediminicola TaxID=2170575 RepID=A0A2T7GBU6_9RHOB|nr:UdgX family uracil-DNA binding protein [Pelagivirga sediminicola]PVA11889.1 uracil-DNA glycosylase [Pelagivirga sediminicola]
MQRVTVPLIGAAPAWRAAARGLLAAGVQPQDVLWNSEGQEGADLFGQDAAMPAAGAATTVPRSFIALATSVAYHRDPQRFARLYALLWRLREAPQLMADRADPDVAKLRAMEKAVHRCRHKMRAFVRFREIGAPDAARRSFAAWFEPEHYTLEMNAPFFAGRFADMDWRIATPDVTAVFERGQMRLEPGQPAPALPPDASEELWLTYFRNIFNPARLKVTAMTSEMPRKYWKNLPEAAAIPDLIATAPERARAMAAAAPTLPPPRAAAAQAGLARQVSAWRDTGEGLEAAIRACTRCPLHCHATQAVCGEGPQRAALMVVGEQPGDQEDLAGRPFVGPAGQLFDKIAAEAGLDRSRAYITNAVKHFKHIPRGRRRIHQRPDAGEVAHCRWWLDAEIERARPDLIVAMGATAALALTGSGARITARRGTVERGRLGHNVLITLHPSYLLRLPEAEARASATADFRADLARAAAI